MTKNFQQRSQAIDVMRGLTVAVMIMVNMSGYQPYTYAPFLHANWHGLTMTDLVFPTFMFVVGIALSYTLGKYQAMGNAAVLKKIFTRTAMIFLAGYLLYWFPFFEYNNAGHLSLLPLSETRILGVLQRLALGYCAASLILHYGKERGAIIFSVIALFGYWALMYYFGDYTLAGNAVLALDRWVMRDKMGFDPEGILSTLPAIVNVIGGYFAGRFIQHKGPTYETIANLMLVGIACIVIAMIWNSEFPINKKLWTSSFVCVTIGIDLLAMAILIYIIDMLALRRGAYFFEVFGKNTLFIYLFSELVMISFSRIYIGQELMMDWIYSHVYQPWAGDKNGTLLFALTVTLGCWLLAYAMDKKRIYIKL
jgi:predicted acyltransferase